MVQRVRKHAPCATIIFSGYGTVWDGFAMHFERPQISDPKITETIEGEFHSEDLRRLGATPVPSRTICTTALIASANASPPSLRAVTNRASGMPRSLPVLQPACGIPMGSVDASTANSVAGS